MTMNAGKGTLNLGGGRFGSIDSTVNAGSVRVDLSEATLQDIGITLNAGDLRLVLPAASFQGSWSKGSTVPMIVTGSPTSRRASS
ncbi:MAG: hypothetical protein E6I94_03200 [Chloroflexi bacterium]|nr:MAG: hypothetical protein E6I94_03200 [Chloroflexota bacterium]